MTWPVAWSDEKAFPSKPTPHCVNATTDALEIGGYVSAAFSAHSFPSKTLPHMSEESTLCERGLNLFQQKWKEKWIRFLFLLLQKEALENKWEALRGWAWSKRHNKGTKRGQRRYRNLHPRMAEGTQQDWESRPGGSKNRICVSSKRAVKAKPTPADHPPPAALATEAPHRNRHRMPINKGAEQPAVVFPHSGVLVCCCLVAKSCLTLWDPHGL